MAITSSKIIIPEVLHDLVQFDYENNLVLAQLCAVNTDLEGKPGESVRVPYSPELSDAEDLLEGASLTPEDTTDAEVSITIKKSGKAVSVTEEAINRASYDVTDDKRIKIARSIARKVDATVNEEFLKTTLVHDISAEATNNTLSYDAIVDAQALMGEEFYTSKPVLVIHSKQMATLRKSEDFKVGFKPADSNFLSFAGMLIDIPVIISDRVKYNPASLKYESMLVCPGAVVLAYKKRPTLNTDYNSLSDVHFLSSFVHYGAKLVNPGRGVVKLITK